MTKKLASVCVLLVLAICVSVSVFAADNTAVVNVNSQSAEVGETVTFTATLSSAKEVFGGSVELVYDKTVLELESGKWLISGTNLSPFYTNTGMGAFVFAPDTTGTASGDIFSATFKVLDTAVAGTSTVEMIISLKYAVDSDATYTVTNNPGSITVVDDSVTTAPETTAPETTAPETTAPVTTAPETTAPETTAPVTTAPVTTVPVTTVPETTAPETKPTTTVPETTAPVTKPTTTSPEETAPEATESTEAPEITAPSESVPSEETQTPEETVSETNAPSDSDDAENPKTGSPVLVVIMSCIVLAVSGTVIVIVMKKRTC